MKYSHTKIEEKWHQKWLDDQLFYSIPDNAKDKLYLLFAFPYPSGSGLHVGHAESMTALDIIARYNRMRGKDVFFPIGWDAFGLPAENYAIKTGNPPEKTTVTAIDTFRRQIKRLAISYTWDHEIATSHPGYYRWTQWLFLKLYKEGLAYKKPGTVNWCPGCQTVLANEQVVDGLCERSDDPVVQKELDQWYFKITQYKDELISGLDEVDWPAATEAQQLNWIGKKEGVSVKFALRGIPGQADDKHFVETFTTRVDTIFGVTFVVISPETANSWIKVGWQASKEVKEYIDKAFHKTEEERKVGEKEKTGVDTGLSAVNPVNGEEVPVYIADYVLSEYGTGAVHGVPAHDERDYDFAKKHNLPIRKVIEANNEFYSLVIKKSVSNNFKKLIEKAGIWVFEYEDWGYRIHGNVDYWENYKNLVQKNLKVGPWYVDTDGATRSVIFKKEVFKLPGEENKAKDYARKISIPDEQIDWQGEDSYPYCYTGINGTLVNSGKFNGLTVQNALKKIPEIFSESMNNVTQYKLRDWLISRQRYWGAPIPIVYDPKGNPHPVKEEHLPWMLPTDVDFSPKGTSPLGSSKELASRVEKLYGKGWTPEIDTMDTFVDSSWYYLRYLSARDDTQFMDPKMAKDWLPIDFYMIGPEHIVLHLLYSRFFTKFLRDQGYMDFSEPFMKMRHQGIIMGPDGKRMSKSRGNVINPDDVIDHYGADTLRMYEMFMGPIDVDKPWNVGAVAGIYRFLNRIHKLFNTLQGETLQGNTDTSSLIHKTLKKVGEDIENLKFNTAIAAMMEMLNELESAVSSRESADRTPDSGLQDADRKIIIQMLAPFAPYLSEELWHQLGESESIHQSSWPKYDDKLIQSSGITVILQVNGKTRGNFMVDKDTKDREVIAMAKKQSDIIKWLEGKKIKKEIFVSPKGRRQGLVNFVV